MIRKVTFVAATAFALTLSSASVGLAQQDPAPLPTEIADALDRSDFVTAREGLAPMAEDDGNALAQFRYGVLLLQGQGGTRDPQAGVAMLERAAQQGYSPAALLLARVYLTDRGPEAQQNTIRAAELLAAAAADNNIEAQYYYALLLQAGRGLEKDEANAVEWFMKAAEGGQSDAQHALSKAYADGKGTPVDGAQALRWLRAAAENGHTEAQFFLANALATGQGAVPDQAEALTWYRRAAEGGMPIAQRILGNHYLIGEDAEARNPAEAFRWLTLSATAGDPGAMYNLGRAYGGDLGIPRDDAKALEWYAKASDSGLGRATFAIAQYHEIGRGGPVDLKKAGLTYRTAAEQGEKPAALRLGYLIGQGVLDAYMPPHMGVEWALVAAKEDDADAKNWLRGHADDGVRDAQTAYGQVLLTDPAQAAAAVPYLKKAALFGDVTAQLELGTLYTTGAEGVALDYVAAHKWLNIAATGGSAKAAETRDVLGSLMTPEQISTAQTATRTFFETASERLPDAIKAGRSDP